MSKRVPLIARYHFAMGASPFLKARALDTNGCTHKPVKASVANILRRVERIEWDWIKKDIYQPEVLEERLESGNARLYDLFDRAVDHKPIGYSLVMEPPERNKFTNNLEGKVVEIENLALFPGHEGKKRGWKFFTRVMDEIFNAEVYGADTVYWSQSSTNHSSLKEYYKRMGMDYLGKDMVPDFTQKPKPTAFEDADHRTRQDNVPQARGAMSKISLPRQRNTAVPVMDRRVG